MLSKTALETGATCTIDAYFSLQNMSSSTIVLKLDDVNPSSSLEEMTSEKDISIAIVGGGAAGLTAAWELCKIGHKNITLYEKEPQVGGKVRTEDGVELGAFFFTPGYKALKNLIAEVGADTCARHYSYFEHEEVSNLKNLTEWVSWYVKVQAAFSLRADWNLPLKQFFQKYDIVMKSKENHMAYVMWPGCGYGSFDSNIPAVYLKRYLDIVGSDFATFFQIAGGNQYLWIAMKNILATRGVVFKNLEVYAVEKTEKGPVVKTSYEREQLYEKVIMATPPVINAKILSEPKFNNWKSFDYFVSHWSGDKGKNNSAYIGTDSIFRKVPNAVIMAAVQASSVVTYQVLCPLDRKNSFQKVSDAVALDSVSTWVQKQQFENPKLIKTKRWDYFPTLSCENLEKDEKWLKEMQGLNGIYYTGAWKQFEIVEYAVRDATDLVRRHFSNQSKPAVPRLLKNQEFHSLVQALSGWNKACPEKVSWVIMSGRHEYD